MIFHAVIDISHTYISQAYVRKLSLKAMMSCGTDPKDGYRFLNKNDPSTAWYHSMESAADADGK